MMSVARDARRRTTAEIKYMRKTARHTWPHYKTHIEIVKELNKAPVLYKLWA
jgi:hypothetical protein